MKNKSRLHGAFCLIGSASDKHPHLQNWNIKDEAHFFFFFVCCLFVCIVKTCAWPHVADRLTEEDAKSVRSCVRTVLHVVDLAEIFKRFIFAKYFEIKKRLPRGFLRILEITNPEWVCVCVCVCITVKENRVSGSGPPVSQVHALERQISKTFSRYTLR